MKKFLKENWFKMVASLILMIIAGISIYYFVFLLPKQKADEMAQQQELKKQADEKLLLEKQQQKDEEDRKKLALQDCLTKVDADYLGRINKIKSSITQVQSQINKLATESENFNHVLLDITTENSKNQDSYTAQKNLNLYNSGVQNFATQQNSKISVLQGKIASFNSEQETINNDKNLAHDDCYKQYE